MIFVNHSSLVILFISIWFCAFSQFIVLMYFSFLFETYLFMVFYYGEFAQLNN